MCLNDVEFNAVMLAVQEKERELIKQISAAKKRKILTQAPEALNRLVEAKYKLYSLRCRGLQDTSKIGLS